MSADFIVAAETPYKLIQAYWRADKEPRQSVQVGLLRVYESHDEQVKRLQREAMG